MHCVLVSQLCVPLRSGAGLKKDPGVPNLHPFKEKLLKQMQETGEMLEAERRRREQALKGVSQVSRFPHIAVAWFPSCVFMGGMRMVSPVTRKVSFPSCG